MKCPCTVVMDALECLSNIEQGLLLKACRLLSSLSEGGPRSAGWRDHAAPGESRRRKFDFDFRDSEGHGGGRRRAGSDGLEDERDGLPEWCTDEEDGEMGTFDSSGAFMPMKVIGFSSLLCVYVCMGCKWEANGGVWSF